MSASGAAVHRKNSNWSGVRTTCNTGRSNHPLNSRNFWLWTLTALLFSSLLFFSSLRPSFFFFFFFSVLGSSLRASTIGPMRSRVGSCSSNCAKTVTLWRADTVNWLSHLDVTFFFFLHGAWLFENWTVSSLMLFSLSASECRITTTIIIIIIINSDSMVICRYLSSSSSSRRWTWRRIIAAVLPVVIGMPQPYLLPPSFPTVAACVIPGICIKAAAAAAIPSRIVRFVWALYFFQENYSNPCVCFCAFHLKFNPMDCVVCSTASFIPQPLSYSHFWNMENKSFQFLLFSVWLH